MAEAAKSGTGVGVAEQALAIVARGQKVLTSMPAKKRTGLLAGVLIVAAVVAGMVWFFNRTEWKVLYSGLEPRDASLVEQELGAGGIAYRTTSDQSGVEVPAELLDKARMEVAAKGMPQTGRLGFEIFDKPNWVGSEFDEKVNFQRALEGELEHTISSLGEVRSARVHLVLPADSLFAQESKVAKASVVLKLKRPELASEQVEAVRRLIAGAVENLVPENVTLVDADGRLDFRAKDQRAHEGDREQALEAKLVGMLEPTVGEGNVRAIVNAEFEEGVEERTDEVYDPGLTAATSLQKTEQSNGAAGKASGVPGTASNTPAAAPLNAVQGSATAAAPGVPPLLQPATAKDSLPVYPERGFGQSQSIKEESGTYAVTKHLLHHESGPGRLKRVTVAVVVNDRMSMEGIGKLRHAVWKPRSTEEMHRLEGLAQAAVGYDMKRGDAVVIENVGFSSNVEEPAAAGLEKVVSQARNALQQQPVLARAGAMALIGFMVVLMVLRPVAKQIVVMLTEPKAVPAPASERAALTANGMHTGASTPGIAADLSGAAMAASEVEVQKMIVEEVSGHIQRKPVQSTKLLEQWINGPQEVA